MNAIQVSLSEYLKTGRLGLIRRGVSQEQVLDLLGPPEDEMVDKTHGKSPVWLYGSIELGFNIPDATTSSLNYIQIQYPDENGRFKGAQNVVLRDDDFHPEGATVEAFADFARRNDIEFRQITPPWLPDDNLLFLTRGNIGVWFTWDPEARKTEFETFITEVRYQSFPVES